MTELVRYTPPPSSLEQAPAAWKLAEKIHNTEAVPTALRGRPEAVLALMLVGHEAGISPMQSLTKIHIIEGRTGMSSELMRGLALQHGHELEYEELTSTKVVARGRRRGAEKWTTIEYTIDDAKRAGLDQKGPWRKFPRQMLTARATGELCRLVFPDVLAGISYTMEELTDGHISDEDAIVAEYVTTVPTSSAPAGKGAPKTARARGGSIAREQPADDPAPPPPAHGAVPPLPGDDDESDIVDAHVIDDETEAAENAARAEVIAEAQTVGATAVAFPPTETAPDPADDWPSGEWETGAADFPIDPDSDHARRFTGPQLVAMKMAEKFGVQGSSKAARDERLRITGLIIGRPVASSNDLTPEEIQTIVQTIHGLPEGATVADLAADAGLDHPAPPATEDPPAAAEPALSPEQWDQAAAPPEAEAETPAPPAKPPAPPRRSTPPPEEWTADAWRDLLAARKVKVTEAIAAAQKMAKQVDPRPRIATLEDITGSGIAGELLGFVEDLALERRPAK